MSRFSDGGDYEYAVLWAQAVRNALHGKRGRAAMLALVEALEALPEKRLIDGSLYESRAGAYCAIGALARHKILVEQGPAELERFQEQYDNSMYIDTVEVARELFGFSQALANGIAWENDEGTWQAETPEQRYQRILNWARELAGMQP